MKSRVIAIGHLDEMAPDCTPVTSGCGHKTDEDALLKEAHTVEIRQYSVADWAAELLRNPVATAQVTLIERRLALGLPLATWEYNCLEAHRQLVRAA